MMATLEGSSEKAYNFTTKWDGAPAIICGIDSIDGKFFVGTKSVGAKRTPKRVKMVKIDDGTGKKGLDLDVFYGGQPELREKLEYAYNHLRHLNLKDFMLQGDLLYTPGSIKTVKIPDSIGMTLQLSLISIRI